jgi:uncharacterized protein YjgD (DUF1641 family)
MDTKRQRKKNKKQLKQRRKRERTEKLLTMENHVAEINDKGDILRPIGVLDLNPEPEQHDPVIVDNPGTVQERSYCVIS